MKIMKHILLIALTLLPLLPGQASAQLLPRPKAKSFKIYDATQPNDRDGKVLNIVDTDNGVEKGYNLAPVSKEARVYVTYKTWADQIMRDYRNSTNRGKVQGFFTFYDNHASYCLQPDINGVYSTEQAYSIAEQLKDRMDPSLREYLGPVPQDIYYLSLIVVVDPLRQEQFDVEWIENFEPNNFVPYCPLYYTGKLKIGNVYKGMTRQIDLQQSTIQLGNELTFQERIDVTGPGSRRMVVERIVEPCDFLSDYKRVGRDYLNNRPALEQLDRLLAHRDGSYAEEFRLTPFVFPGKNYQKRLLRRTQWDTDRDTMEYYRKETLREFGTASLQNEYRALSPDSCRMQMDYNLLARYLSKYETFWALSPELEKLRMDEYPTYPDTADRRSYHFVTLSIETYRKVQQYVEEGKMKEGRWDAVVEGFVPRSYLVRQLPSTYKEYWYSLPLYRQMLEVPDYKKLVDDGTVKVVRPEQNGLRMRYESSDEKKVSMAFNQMRVTNPDLYLDPQQPIRDTLLTRWTMRDPNIYYRLKHVYWLHDFQAADTATDACGCTRMNPLRFISLSLQPAAPDCPPFIAPTSQVKEDYRPLSKSDDVQELRHEVHVAFERASATIVPELGDNTRQLDSLSQTAAAIMGRDEKWAPYGVNRIDTIAVLGITSPEGGYQYNMTLARNRSEAVVGWLRAHNEIRTAAEFYTDSVATWLDVAAAIDHFMPESADQAQRIREVCEGRDPRSVTADEVGYVPNDSVWETAMNYLRRVQITFQYSALQPPTEEAIVQAFRSGISTGAVTYGAFYYYVLLTSDQLTEEEKVRVSQEVLEAPRRRGDENFCWTHDVNRASSEQWFDLIRPIAANNIAVYKMDKGEYDETVLAPYIDLTQGGNRKSYSLGTLIDETPKAYKYVNADFALYNQIQILIGIGSNATLQRADSMIQILSMTDYSREFEAKYHPSRLPDLLESFNYQMFIDDAAFARRIANTNIVNYYVVHNAIGHDKFQRTGRYSDPVVQEAFRATWDSIPALDRLPEKSPERWYFRAVAYARWAEMMAQENKAEQLQEAVASLARLFETDEDYVSFCQGDIYIRGIYSTPANRQSGLDIYLEAVERYINKRINKE